MKKTDINLVKVYPKFVLKEGDFSVGMEKDVAAKNNVFRHLRYPSRIVFRL
jgi:hypothetical protein